MSDEGHLGDILLRALDHVSDDVKVLRGIVILELDSPDMNTVVYETTGNMSWTDHLGLFRRVTLLAEAGASGRSRTTTLTTTSNGGRAWL